MNVGKHLGSISKLEIGLSVLQNYSSQSIMAEAAATGLLTFGLSLGFEIIFPELCTVLYSKFFYATFFFLLQGRTLWVQKSSSPCCLKNILTFCRCHDFLLKREKCFFLYLLCKFQNPSILTVRYARLLKDENIGMDIFLNCLKFISFHVWTKVQSCVQSLYMKIMEYLPLFRIAFISWLWLLLKIFSVPQYEKWYFKFQ